ncbi:hypothetical protein K402DRAFT_173853 [Aulographum hederae CBS 113979]|uniref:Uncharacterized protein n=1 Tax=Aulographum hederae CBS 113979 TaxID=1176131 RepID=A0A6G1HDU5_9PEZI|nr:hypothetical protein K402DRAFT_173853 [Aulographum hederae CBS 113979]
MADHLTYNIPENNMATNMASHQPDSAAESSAFNIEMASIIAHHQPAAIASSSIFNNPNVFTATVNSVVDPALLPMSPPDVEAGFDNRGNAEAGAVLSNAEAAPGLFDSSGNNGNGVTGAVQTDTPAATPVLDAQMTGTAETEDRAARYPLLAKHGDVSFEVEVMSTSSSHSRHMRIAHTEARPLSLESLEHNLRKAFQKRINNPQAVCIHAMWHTHLRDSFLHMPLGALSVGGAPVSDETIVTAEKLAKQAVSTVDNNTFTEVDAENLEQCIYRLYYGNLRWDLIGGGGLYDYVYDGIHDKLMVDFDGDITADEPAKASSARKHNAKARAKAKSKSKAKAKGKAKGKGARTKVTGSRVSKLPPLPYRPLKGRGKADQMYYQMRDRKQKSRNLSLHPPPGALNSIKNEDFGRDYYLKDELFDVQNEDSDIKSEDSE